MSLTPISKEPTVAKHAIDVVSRLNPKYHFPVDLKSLERHLRISLGLPFKKRIQGIIPYGYEYDSETDTYNPNPVVFDLLWQARRYLYTSSLREVADWLNFKCKNANIDQQISHEGLRNLFTLRPPYEECLLPTEEKEQILASLTQWIQKKQ